MGSEGKGRGKRRRIPMVVVDTFADRPFSGSPCPVCLVPYGMVLDEVTMENISSELSMAEVAFVRPLSEHDDLTTSNKNRQVTCVTRFSGDIAVRRNDDDIQVDFPLGITVRKTEAEYANFIKALGRVPGIQDVFLCPSLKYLLLCLSPGWTRTQFEEWHCDMALMEQAVAMGDIYVVIVTMAADASRDETGKPYDFLSRAFVPFSVRPEDFVTGSAQTVLAHYWSQRLGKHGLYTRQCSFRGGDVVMTVEEDRVHVMAHATVVMEGVLSV